MNETIRLLVAFLLVFLIITIWQFFLTPRKRPTMEKPMPIDTAKLPIKTEEPRIESRIKEIKKHPELEQEVVLENGQMRVVFSNLGGTIKSVFLKKFSAELIPQNTKPLGLDLRLSDSIVQSAELPFNFIKTDSTLLFYNNRLKKTYSLKRDYILGLKIEITNENLGYSLFLNEGIAPTEPNQGNDIAHFRFYAKTITGLKGFDAKKIKTGVTLQEKTSWLGLRTKYFLLTVVPVTTSFDSITGFPLPDRRLGFSGSILRPRTSDDFLIYFLPLDYELLKSEGKGFESAVELGFFKPFALAILKILKFLYNIFKNYGIVIIIFSVLMKIVFYPFTRTQTKMMRQMQLLQPKIAELKKKYKNDPKTLNQETMRLYSLYKINPFSGCLPLLIQLPIFWALYTVFNSTIDLRRARFVFWISDLSLKDPYFVLPILMGVSFMIQNLLTSTDKKNWLLTIFFPIFLTVVFLNFPAGLQLYWLFYNILSILESLIVKKGGIKWLRTKEPKMATS